ncbi:MAG: lytic murein transglycosylase [Candidatus Paceibacterota bacterium]|jgi:peptidoglycan hydrolase CwlO-like protein
MKNSFKNILLLIIVLSVFTFTFAFSPVKIFAQSSDLTNAQSERQKLEQELAQLEQEIAQKQAELANQKGQSKTIQEEISKLTSKINTTKLNIKAKNLTIKKLGGEITEKVQTINTLVEKIGREKDSLSQLIRKTNEIDNQNILHLVLSSESVSAFYSDLDSFASINESIKYSVDQIRENKTVAEKEKDALKQKQEKEIDVKNDLENQQKQIQIQEKEKNSLLGISKNKEKEFQTILSERAKRAEQIKNALFSLNNSSTQISFGTALDYANFIYKQTNVRPAFLLAILTQETNLGKNVGTCLLKNSTTGSGIRTTTGATLSKVMKPDRDVRPFLAITKVLNLDPYGTKISCPQSIGYGGAMGPAQFIPSTWELYESKIQKALGISTTPNPWSPKDAFMASAIYLAELGADEGGYTAESRAAAKYYAGGNWKSKSGQTYARSVLSIANNTIQPKIDQL